MLFVCHPKVLHKHFLQFLLGGKMAPKRNWKQCLYKILGWQTEHYGMLRYFLEWSIGGIFAYFICIVSYCCSCENETWRQYPWIMRAFTFKDETSVSYCFSVIFDNICMERTWIREISLEGGMMILRGIGGLKLCVCECALVCLFAVRGGERALKNRWGQGGGRKIWL